jgi:hypothetical protein
MRAGINREHHFLTRQFLEKSSLYADPAVDVAVQIPRHSEELESTETSERPCLGYRVNGIPVNYIPKSRTEKVHVELDLRPGSRLHHGLKSVLRGDRGDPRAKDCFKNNLDRTYLGSHDRNSYQNPHGLLGIAALLLLPPPATLVYISPRPRPPSHSSESPRSARAVSEPRQISGSASSPGTIMVVGLKRAHPPFGTSTGDCKSSPPPTGRIMVLVAVLEFTETGGYSYRAS